MSEEKVNMDALTLELKRGTQVLGVLSQLKTPMYGYSLVEKLAAKGMEIDKNTLYPLLRRLEKQGLLKSEWNVEEARPRRYYVISETGKQVLAELAKAWDTLDDTVRRLLKED